MCQGYTLVIIPDFICNDCSACVMCVLLDIVAVMCVLLDIVAVMCVLLDIVAVSLGG